MLKVRDIITLNDNNEYMVISNVKYKNDNYVYLLNIADTSDIKILKLNIENGKLISVEDRIIKRLMPLFFKEASKYTSLFSDKM